MIAAENGDDDNLAADVAFHVAILDATGNPFYQQLDELIRTALQFSIRVTNRIVGHSASVPAHRRVFDAIRSGDPAGASAAMTAIIVESQALIASVKRRGRGRSRP